jgi:hypothetical protein
MKEGDPPFPDPERANEIRYEAAGEFFRMFLDTIMKEADPKAAMKGYLASTKREDIAPLKGHLTMLEELIAIEALTPGDKQRLNHLITFRDLHEQRITQLEKRMF